MIARKIKTHNLFIIFLIIITFYAVIYQIVDLPLELQRRTAQGKPHQDLIFIDYFIFSLLMWSTVGDGNGRFATVDWSKESRYVNICQGITILLFMTFPFMWLNGDRNKWFSQATYVFYITIVVIIYCMIKSHFFTNLADNANNAPVHHMTNYL
jgi:hypothetical protein